MHGGQRGTAVVRCGAAQWAQLCRQGVALAEGSPRSAKSYSASSDCSQSVRGCPVRSPPQRVLRVIMSPVLYGLSRTRPPAGSDDAQTGHESSASLEWWRIAAGGRACDIRSKACALNSRSMGEAVVASAATHCAHSSLSQMPPAADRPSSPLSGRTHHCGPAMGRQAPGGLHGRRRRNTTAGHACAT
jgi:hypothetical protein